MPRIPWDPPAVDERDGLVTDAPNTTDTAKPSAIATIVALARVIAEVDVSAHPDAPGIVVRVMQLEAMLRRLMPTAAAEERRAAAREIGLMVGELRGVVVDNE